VGIQSFICIFWLPCRMSQTHWLCGRISICFATLAQFQVGFWLYSFRMKTCYIYICAIWWNTNLQLHVHFHGTRCIVDWLQQQSVDIRVNIKNSFKNQIVLFGVFSYMTAIYTLFLTPQQHVIYLLHNSGHIFVSYLDFSVCICCILCYCAPLIWMELEDSRL
jgi:hypothetical protein